MERNEGTRMSAEEKLKVVEEGRQSGATISEVCRRHQVSHAQFYRWERLARQGALEALRNGARRAKNGKHEQWLMKTWSIWCLLRSTGFWTGMTCSIAGRAFRLKAQRWRKLQGELFDQTLIAITLSLPIERSRLRR